MATARGELHRLRGHGPIVRTSLYADDAAIFVAPYKEDLRTIAEILEGFGEVTGLVTNIHKSMAAPIRCSNIDLGDIMQHFPVPLCTFPMKYLGLPLSTRRLKIIDVQPLLDKMANKLAPWQGKYIATAGRGTLVKSVITTRAIHHITPLTIPPSLFHAINKLKRAFFWAGTDKVSGGQCKVN